MILRTELLEKLKIAKVLDMLSLSYYRKGPDCEKLQQTLRKTVWNAILMHNVEKMHCKLHFGSFL